MNPRLFRPFVWFIALLCLAAGAWAQDMGALRARMQERLPQLDALKAQGVIGETNDGYVATRVANNKAAETLVAAENVDRKAVYEAIARRTESDHETVGKIRARQIAENSAVGVWIQSSTGKWEMKKPIEPEAK